MTQFIETLFNSVFGDNIILATILIAMVPIVELKGAIPFSMSAQIWGANALSLWQSFLWGFVGSSLIVPILALIYLPVIKWLKKTKLFKRLGEKLENKINTKKDDISLKVENIEEKENQNQENKIITKQANQKQIQNEKKYFTKSFLLKLFFVFIFVAVPLPFTGVWTGTCIAIALGLGFWWSCLTVIVANCCAGLMITAIASLFSNSTLIIFYIFMAIILIVAVFVLVRNLIRNKKNQKQ